MFSTLKLINCGIPLKGSQDLLPTLYASVNKTYVSRVPAALVFLHLEADCTLLFCSLPRRNGINGAWQR